MVGEDILCTRKVRFYPNKQQKSLFNKCFKAHRYCYNNAIREINNRYNTQKDIFTASKTCICDKCIKEKTEKSFFCKEHIDNKIKWNLSITLPSVRNSSMKTNKQLILPEELWLKEVPFDTRGYGVSDAISAYKTCITNKQNGNINNFKLHFKRSDSPSHIFWISKKAISPSFSKKNNFNGFNIFPQKLKTNSRLRFMKKEIRTLKNILKSNEIDNDSKIQLQGKSYYLIINFKRKIENTLKTCSIASLDPGVRTFQTLYSPDGIIGKFGEKTLINMKKLHIKLDQLQSVRSKISPKKLRRVRNIKLKEKKVRKKIRDIVSNLHNQTGSYLSKNYNNVILPEFGISKLVRDAKLASSVKREMMSYRFYDFKQKLNHLCNVSGTKLTIVSEAYTTRTCTRCGQINNNVKGNKEFTCNHCNLKIDRDINGSRNILIRRLT